MPGTCPLGVVVPTRSHLVQDDDQNALRCSDGTGSARQSAEKTVEVDVPATESKSATHPQERDPGFRCWPRDAPTSSPLYPVSPPPRRAAAALAVVAGSARVAPLCAFAPPPPDTNPRPGIPRGSGPAMRRSVIRRRGRRQRAISPVHRRPETDAVHLWSPPRGRMPRGCEGSLGGLTSVVSRLDRCNRATARLHLNRK